MAAEVEQVLLVVREAFVYKLPPRSMNKGYRAADWGLDQPLWTGRLKVTQVGQRADLTLLDNSGKLFAQAPIIGDTVSKVVEPVLDSSRYFVVRVENQGKHAYLGMGFAERSDAFDFNVALQEFSKSLKKEQISNEPYVPKHDLKMKEGETIRISIKGKAKGGDDDEKKAAPMVSLDASAFAAASGGGGSPASLQNPFAALSLGASGSGSKPAAATTNPFAAPASGSSSEASADVWGDFATAGGSNSNSGGQAGGSSSNGGGWVAFS